MAIPINLPKLHIFLLHWTTQILSINQCICLFVCLCLYQFIYLSIINNLLNTNYNYLNYKLPSNTGLTPGTTSPVNTTGNIQIEDVGVVSTLSTSTSSLYPIIEIDPVQDLKNLGYSLVR